MFKRLKDKIVEEANKFPVGQNTGGSSSKSSDGSSKSLETPDLITLSDSSSVIIPHSSSNFSIADDEDESSESGSPQKKNGNNSAGSELCTTPSKASTFDFSMETNSSSQFSSQPSSPFVPHTDIESEMDEPPTLNLDEISKSQLLHTIQKLKARNHKYKTRYSLVVSEYKLISEEKKKLEHALTDNQDKSLRRIAELREQCQLEQNAKAHLEENLRLILEEKDSRISVLETQINLLKQCQTETKRKTNDDVESSDEISTDLEQIQKLKSLLKECRTKLVSKSEQINMLMKEKAERQNEDNHPKQDFEEKEQKIRLEYEDVIKTLKKRMCELEQQQEDSVMSMAETKKNMHEELEIKERQLIKTKEDLRKIQTLLNREKSSSLDRMKQHEEKVIDLQRQLDNMEKMMEDEKQGLMRDLSRGKTEAINLMKNECSKRVSAVEEEWKTKYSSLEQEHKKTLTQKEEEFRKQLEEEKEVQSCVEVNGESVIDTKTEECTQKSSPKSKNEAHAESQDESLVKAHVTELNDKILEKQSLVEEQDRIIENLKRKISELTYEHAQWKQKDIGNSDAYTKQKYIYENLYKDKEIALQLCRQKEKVLQLKLNNLHSENKKFSKQVQMAQAILLQAKIQFLLYNQECKLMADSYNAFHIVTEKRYSEISQVLTALESQTQIFKKSLESLKMTCHCIVKKLVFLDEKLEHVVTNKMSKRKCAICESGESSDEKEIEPVQITDEDVCTEPADDTERRIDNVLEKNILGTNICSNDSISSKDVLSVPKELTKIEDEQKSRVIVLKTTIKRLVQIVMEVEKKGKENAFNFENDDGEDERIILPIGASNTLSKTAKNRKTKELKSKNGNSSLKQTNLTSELENLANIIIDAVDEIMKEDDCTKQELGELKHLSEVQGMNYAREVTTLQHSLTNVQEERNNLSAVLQSMESDIGLSKKKFEYTKEKLKSYKARITELEASNKLFEDKEVELNELLRKTQGSYESQMVEINSDLQMQINSFNVQTGLLNNQLKDLKDELQASQRDCAEKNSELMCKLLRRSEIIILLKEELDATLEKNMEFVDNEKTITNRKTELENQLKGSVEMVISLQKRLKELEESTKSEMLEFKESMMKTEEGHEHRIKQLLEQLNEANEKSKDFLGLKEKCNDLEAIVSKLTEISNKTQCAMKELENQKLVAEENMKQLQSQLEEHQERMQNTLASKDMESQELAQSYKTLSEVYEMQKLEVSSMEQQLQAYIEQFNIASNLQSKLDIVREKLTETESSLQEIQSSKQILEQQVMQLHKTIEENQSQFHSLLAAKDSELKAFEDAISTKNSDYQQLSEKYNELSNSFEIHKESLCALEQQLLESTKKNCFLSGAMEKCSNIQKDLDDVTKLLAESEFALKETSNSKKELEEKMEQLQNTLEQNEIQVKTQLATKDTELNAMECIMQQKDTDYQTLAAKYDELSESCDIQKLQLSTLERVLQDIRQDNESLLNIKKQCLSLQGELDSVKANLAKSELALHNVLNEKTAVEGKVEQMTTSLQETLELLEAKNLQLKTMETAMSCQDSENKQLLEKHNELKESFESQKQQLDALESQLQVAEQGSDSFEHLKEKYSNLQKEFDKIQKQLSELQNTLQETVKNKEESDAQVEKLTKNLGDSHDHLQYLLKEKDSELKAMNAIISKKDSEHLKLSNQCNELRESYEIHNNELELQLANARSELEMLANLREKCLNLQTDLDDCKTLLTEAESASQAALDAKNFADESVEKLTESLKESQQNFKNLLAQKETELMTMGKTVSKKDAECHQLKSQHTALKESCNIDKNRLDALEQQLAEAKRENKALVCFRENNVSLKNDLDNTTKQISQLELAVQEAVSNKQIVNEELKQAHENVQRLKDLLASKDDGLMAVQTVISIKELELNKLSEKYNVLKDEELSTKSAHQELKGVVESHLAQITKLEKELATLREKLSRVTKDHRGQIDTMESEFKIKLDELASENSEKLKSKDCEIKNLQMAIEEKEKEFEGKMSQILENFQTKANDQSSELKSRLETLQTANLESEKEFERKYAKLLDDFKRNQNVMTQLKSNLESIEARNSAKVEELNKKIKQLEHEREQLMMQAQERVAATELKCREDLDKLNEELHELQLQSKELARLKSENSVLNVQLDESLLVAAANQAESSEELSCLKKIIQELKEEYESYKSKHSLMKMELENTISELRNENSELEKNKKQEVDELNEKIKSLQDDMVQSEILKDRVRELQVEIEGLKVELDSANCLKNEKDQLNKTIRTLEMTKKDLQDTVKQLLAENESLRMRSARGDCTNCDNVNSLKLENMALKDQVKSLEARCNDALLQVKDESKSKNITNAQLQGAGDGLNIGIRSLQTETGLSDSNIDQTSHQKHQLEIAALKQDLFEKDCALDEIREQYDGLLKEKNARRDCEMQSPMHLKCKPNSDSLSAEASDWDDTWVVPDEHCETSSPAHIPKTECESHVQKIDEMQEELNKCNSEIKELRILLRLSPPQPVHSNNNYCNSDSHIPEPTEIEYLKNILFKYMMGKETVTLAKVIAAVLRFDEEQTQLVMEREKSKQPTK